MTHPTTIGKYDIIEHLGGGNFGQVYHVHDKALSAYKALKILNVDDPTLFMNHLKEAQILNACKHKHIVTINEANIFEINGCFRVVLDLEFLPDGSLESIMQKRWISIREAVTYMRGALCGLQHAHSQEFLHRDIKPGNILLDGNTAKLSDFGLATAIAPNIGASGRGYSTHLAPEFFQKHNTTILTDVFATGMTLFRVLSNFLNWEAVVNAIPNNEQHIQNGTLFSKIGLEDYIPQKLKRIIRKSCHANAAKRFQSAKELSQQLDSLRFAIDWTKISEFEWQGQENNKKHTITINPINYKVVVKKNERRVMAHCKSYNSIEQAVAAQNRYIADTSLKD